MRNRFTPRHFFDRHRCHIVHSARNSNFTTCGTLCKLRLESRSICARHRYCFPGHLGAIPPLGTGHFRKKENDGPSEVAAVRCDIFERDEVLHWSHIPEMPEEFADVAGAIWFTSGASKVPVQTQGHFFMLHECQSPGCFGRGAGSISWTTPRRISRPLLCKSNTMPKLGARVCGLMCFAKTTEILFTLSPTMPFFFGRFMPREYVVRLSASVVSLGLCRGV